MLALFFYIFVSLIVAVGDGPSYLVRGDDVERGSSAPDHARNVVEHCVRLLLLGKQLDVRVEKVSLCDVDSLAYHLVDELEDARRDGRLAHLQEARREVKGVAA